MPQVLLPQKESNEISDFQRDLRRRVHRGPTEAMRRAALEGMRRKAEYEKHLEEAQAKKGHAPTQTLAEKPKASPEPSPDKSKEQQAPSEPVPAQAKEESAPKPASGQTPAAPHDGGQR
jgi:hypothetical protein